jgi:hypothetical protein
MSMKYAVRVDALVRGDDEAMTEHPAGYPTWAWPEPPTDWTPLVWAAREDAIRPPVPPCPPLPTVEPSLVWLAFLVMRLLQRGLGGVRWPRRRAAASVVLTALLLLAYLALSWAGCAPEVIDVR